MEIILSYQELKPYRIGVTVIRIGKELMAVVEGGDRPHIGSIAVAVPCRTLSCGSRENDEKTSSTVSIYNVVGHKDDQIASPLAHLIARNFSRVTVVLAGIHIDNAVKKDIEGILNQMSKVNIKVVEKLKEKDV
jgi:hypothetical protein